MKIGTQLTAGAFGIGAVVLANLGIIFLKSSDSDVKVVNLSGAVRGGTQRAIKLEIVQKHDVQLLKKLNNSIDSLINGNIELEIPPATDPVFLSKMQEVEADWKLVENLMARFNQTPNDANRDALLAESEKLFQLTNEAVDAAEQLAGNNVQQLRTIQLFVTLLNFFIVQASSVGQTTSTVDILGETSRRSAIQAEESAESASKALALAESGAETVEQTRIGMESLKDRVKEIAEQIINLSEQTEQIAGVSELVGDLANQTNMLALNAAVEAARAGEYGKGFGVVAGEIRKLADQSRKSADKINNLVVDVQAAMNSAVMVTDEGKKTAESSIELALGTAESFIGVKEAVNNVFSNASEISSAAKQQAVGIQEILAAVNALNLGAMDTAADMEEVRGSTMLLKQSTEELKAIV